MVAEGQGVISLEQCVQQALEANYSIKMFRNEEQIADNNANIAPFLPTLNADAQQTQRINQTKSTIGGESISNSGVKSDVLSAGVALDWRLFDGLSMFTTYEKYREIASVGELNTQMALENLVLAVSEAYYDVVIQHNKLEAVRHSLTLSRDRYNEALDKYVLGVLSGLEAQQAKIDLNADSSRYVKQQEVLKSAYITLNHMLNIELDKAMYVRDSISLLDQLIIGELKENTLSSNTALLIARKDQKISALDVKIARSALFPTLDFNSGYNYSRTETPSASTSLNRTNGFYWGFTLRMPLFDRLENNRKIRNARLTEENAEWSGMELELQVMADLAQLYNNYENNLHIVNFEIENSEIAYDNLDAALEKYKIGSLPGIEFREFQRSYIDAIDRKLSAIYQAKISELSLLLISGQMKVVE